MVIVGDVAGRGAPAAALTALARHTLRTAGRLLDDPAGALAELNQELYARGSGALCTLVCALLPEDPADRTVEVLCAGHPQPVLLRDGAARQVGRFGTIVGAFADATWTSERVEVVPGDTLVLYTDGVIDAVGKSGRFGEERLLDALGGTRSAREAIECIDRSLLEFERGPQADDTAALALRRAAGAPATAGDAGPSLSEERMEVVELLVSELVTNAVRHGEGAIRLRLGREADLIRAEVADEGAGLRVELRERRPDEVG